MNKLSPEESWKLNQDIKKYYVSEGPFFLAKLYPHLTRSFILKRANKLGFRLKNDIKTIIYKENAEKSSATLKSKKDGSHRPKDPIGLSDEMQVLACCKPWGWKPPKPKKSRNS